MPHFLLRQNGVVWWPPKTMKVSDSPGRWNSCLFIFFLFFFWVAIQPPVVKDISKIPLSWYFVKLWVADGTPLHPSLAPGPARGSLLLQSRGSCESEAVHFLGYPSSPRANEENKNPHHKDRDFYFLWVADGTRTRNPRCHRAVLHRWATATMY